MEKLWKLSLCMIKKRKSREVILKPYFSLILNYFRSLNKHKIMIKSLIKNSMVNKYILAYYINSFISYLVVL